MIPGFNDEGRLPPGVHWTDWAEVELRFGASTYRQAISRGLKRALDALRKANCSTVFIDGSFVTSKLFPEDFDACWSVVGVDPDLLDPVLLDFTNGRASQKASYLGELFPAELPEAASGKTWLEFFQGDKDGRPKGIIAIDLGRLP